MKLPFINRKRYIVLKCYTTHEGVLRHAPITTKYKQVFNNEKLPDGVVPRFARMFKTCPARIESAKLSATILAPVTINFGVWKDKTGHHVSDTGIEDFEIDISHQSDPTFEANKQNHLFKIEMPWKCYEETGVKFVLARHIANPTMMNVVSGVLDFKQNATLNVFNLVHTSSHEYEVPFGTPIASLYPMSDLPLHVECYNDKDQYVKLAQMQYRKFARSDHLKTKKIIDEAD